MPSLRTPVRQCSDLLAPSSFLRGDRGLSTIAEQSVALDRVGVTVFRDIMGRLAEANGIGSLGLHRRRIHRRGGQEVDEVFRGKFWLIHK